MAAAYAAVTWLGTQQGDQQVQEWSEAHDAEQALQDVEGTYCMDLLGPICMPESSENVAVMT